MSDKADAADQQSTSDASSSTDGAQGPWYADGLQFTCTQCGDCCTGDPGVVWVTDEELKAIADHLDKPIGGNSHDAHSESAWACFSYRVSKRGLPPFLTRRPGTAKSILCDRCSVKLGHSGHQICPLGRNGRTFAKPAPGPGPVNSTASSPSKNGLRASRSEGALSQDIDFPVRGAGDCCCGIRQCGLRN